MRCRWQNNMPSGIYLVLIATRGLWENRVHESNKLRERERERGELWMWRGSSRDVSHENLETEIPHTHHWEKGRVWNSKVGCGCGFSRWSSSPCTSVLEGERKRERLYFCTADRSVCLWLRLESWDEYSVMKKTTLKSPMVVVVAAAIAFVSVITTFLDTLWCPGRNRRLVADESVEFEKY